MTTCTNCKVWLKGKTHSAYAIELCSLHAAAPALLEALKAVHRALETLSDPHEDGANCAGHFNTTTCIQDDIEQAIAKAEGK